MPVVDYDDSVYQEKLAGKKYLLFNSALSMLKGTHIGIESADELMNRYPEKQYAKLRKLLSASSKNIPLNEIVDCIDKVVVDYGGKIVVKWSIGDSLP